MTARFSSASAYLQDAFLISFVMLFIDAEARFPLALIWLVLTLITAVLTMLLSWQKGYMPKLILVAGVLVMTLSLVAGVTIGTFIILTILSLYRLHTRFSVIEDDSNGESFFLLIFLLIFTSSLVLSILNPFGNSYDLLLPLAAATIIFYTLSRFFYRYLIARQDGARLSHALVAAVGITLVSAGTAAFVYLIADEARQLAGTIVGAVLAVVLWPFAGVLDWLVKFVNGLSNEEDVLKNISNMEDETEQPKEILFSETTEFDYTFIGVVAIVLIVIIGIFLLRKIKPDIGNQKKEIITEINRFSTVSAGPKELERAEKYDVVNIHEIRKAFREFEEKSMVAEKRRMEHETVREWAQREGLPFTEMFFKTYDKARYSDGNIARSEASPFFAELEKINKNIFLENV